MGFTPLAVVQHPPWDANTDEAIEVFSGADVFAYVVPHQCYYVIFSQNASVACFLSPDATDVDSGLRWGTNVGDLRVRMPVVPGTTIQVHTAGAVTINFLQFYNDEI